MSGVELVEEFAIKEGHNGCFIEEMRTGKDSINSTFFGRYYKAFDVTDYEQRGQNEQETATLYVTMKNCEEGGDMVKLFDLTNVDVDFEFKVEERPVRTAMGKLKLRV